MNTQKGGILLRLVLAATLIVSPMTVLAQNAQNQSDASRAKSTAALMVPITGTVRPESNLNLSSPLNGLLTIQRFSSVGDTIVAIGTLTANVTDPVTNASRTIVTQVALPLDRQASAGQAQSAVVAEAACNILHLVLGPLDLNLLGLRIQLNRVVLDITAVPGPGNLLGNLLCALTGLLDGTGSLARILALLNDLLALLG